MKKLVLAISFCFCMFSAFADHLKGGFFTYEYLGHGAIDPTALRYHVKLTVYMVCNPNPAQVNSPINFTFFDANTRAKVRDVSVTISKEYDLQKTFDEPCISGNQAGCYYHIVEYDLTSVELPDNGFGYVISYQRCCRIAGIQNMPLGVSNTMGNTYSIEIPGTNTVQNGYNNRSAAFLVNDTAVVCGGGYFQFPFIANDADGDSLAYSFCDAWDGGSQANPAPASASPPIATNPILYGPILYASGFSGATPLGSQANINAKTGLVSGIAPSVPGEYVVTVCVDEYRNGQKIATTRKELHLKVGDCSAIRATLSPEYVNCNDLTVSFSNQTPNGIQNYYWDFGVTTQTNDTSDLAAPDFTYPDTGVYQIKLVVNRGHACSDSTTALARVFPGFYPGFTVSGFCVNKPIQFTDTSHAAYGFINSWDWDFGDPNNNGSDVSTVQNPTYTYSQIGTNHVQFIVSSSKGCIDTIEQDIEIIDKPPLKTIPEDTLICNGDNVLLQAVGTGNFSWTGPNVSNTTTPNITVQPSTTSNYIVTLESTGCVNQDTVHVRVVNFVSLAAMPDTVICTTDTIRLRTVSDGLHYTWTPAATVLDPTAQNPRVVPVNNPTTYQVTASIGHCIATDDVTVALVPYPTASAGIDQTICYDGRVQLHASIVGSAFTWTPSGSLDNPNSLDPIASPVSTTSYILSVTDDLGCPKPKKDTVLVTVLPRVIAYAGHDTVVVIGQPLQLGATGGVHYAWTPSTGLNHNDIPNPIGLYNAGNADSIRYKVIVKDEHDCSDSAYVVVKVFKTAAQIFVPTAFTPNGDGRNDRFRPIAVGITHIDYFRVYNRWGQLVYDSPSIEGGWDGRIKGQEQSTASFVWIVKGTDYTGKPFFAKGTVTLIR